MTLDLKLAEFTASAFSLWLPGLQEAESLSSQLGRAETMQRGTYRKLPLRETRWSHWLPHPP